MNSDAAPMSSIGKLAEALSTAQGEIKCALVDSENPAYKRGDVVSKYADLAAVWDACREALSKNKLAVIQTTHRDGDGWILRTTLAHASGESISGDFPLRPLKPDMQGFTGATTYARRAGLAAICGVAPRDEDDDGNTASGVQVETRRATPGKTQDRSPPAQVTAPKPLADKLAAAVKWADEAIKTLDPLPTATQVLDWEVSNDKHMARLKAANTEQWNRVKGFLLQKLDALGYIDGERTAAE